MYTYIVHPIHSICMYIIIYIMRVCVYTVRSKGLNMQIKGGIPNISRRTRNIYSIFHTAAPPHSCRGCGHGLIDG